MYQKPSSRQDSGEATKWVRLPMHVIAGNGYNNYPKFKIQSKFNVVFDITVVISSSKFWQQYDVGVWESNIFSNALWV